MAKMGTERGMDRVIFFTDAVAAIAITLLILPLVDFVPDWAAEHNGSADAVPEFFSAHAAEIGAFVLSFVIIARMWIANHGVLERVERPTPALIWLNLAWAFTIVLLPLPTVITASFKTNPTSIAFYIGTMLASSLMLTALSYVIYRTPEVEGPGDREPLTRLWGVGITSVAFAVAFILGVSIPQVNYWGLLALLLTGPLDRLVKPRLRKLDEQNLEAREAAAKAATR